MGSGLMGARPGGGLASGTSGLMGARPGGGLAYELWATANRRIRVKHHAAGPCRMIHHESRGRDIAD